MNYLLIILMITAINFAYHLAALIPPINLLIALKERNLFQEPPML